LDKKLTELLRTPISSNLALSKLEDALINLSSRLKEAESSSIAVSSNEIFNSISTYFLDIADAEFNPDLIAVNDTPSSEHYNRNLLSIHNDLKRFYEDLKNLVSEQVKSYNYAQIISQDILSRANSLASTVLDLNILNNFNRGDTIVAGDDFNTNEFIDVDAGLGSERAEILPGGAGLSLARDSAIDVIDNNTAIDIVPLSPAGAGNTVNTGPTQDNLERFYEGNYYNFIGQARPEGGQFNFKTIIEEETFKRTQRGFLSSKKREVTITRKGKFVSTIVDLGASPEDKALARLKVFDKDPSTFWECEFLYRNPLAQSTVSSRVEGSANKDVGSTSVISIDINQANRLAKEADAPGRDLVVDLIITLAEVRSINFVSVNPILFGPDSYPEIVDISTTDKDDGNFTTVDGWESLKFAKFLTPEANELLTDSQQNAILAPNRAAFRGQGIFNFPTKEAKKIKVRIKVDTPVSSPYERVYALLTNNIKVTTVTAVTTTRKKVF
jgi:hypothetical protein